MEDFLACLSHDFTSFDLNKLVDDLKDQLSGEAIPGTTAMLPSYLRQLPRGTEKGDYLALDLGGSTFRAAIVHLPGHHEPPKITRSASWEVAESAKTTTFVVFFDWIASCVRELLGPIDCKSCWPTGLAFSFPIDETGLNTGRILTMGKGYRFTDDIGGRCIKSHLDDAFEKAGLRVTLEAVINDSIATMISQKYRDPKTKMSLILGTGCNSALFMPISAFKCTELHRSKAWLSDTSAVMVNAELSTLGKKFLPMTKYDQELDRATALPKYQLLEQLTSGRHLGELVRLILVDAVRHFGLFDGTLPFSLTQERSLDSKTIGVIEEDTSENLSNSCQLMDALHTKQAGIYTTQEAQFIKEISWLVSSRSAKLIAASLTALISFAAEHESEDVKDDSIIAFCGTFIGKYPGYQKRCQDVLNKLQSRLRLVEARESSLLGAAITAALVSA